MQDVPLTETASTKPDSDESGRQITSGCYLWTKEQLQRSRTLTSPEGPVLSGQGLGQRPVSFNEAGL